MNLTIGIWCAECNKFITGWEIDSKIYHEVIIPTADIAKDHECKRNRK